MREIEGWGMMFRGLRGIKAVSQVSYRPCTLPDGPQNVRWSYGAGKEAGLTTGRRFGRIKQRKVVPLRCSRVASERNH